MKFGTAVLAPVVALALLLGGCDGEKEEAAPPAPQELTREAMGHYDHMVVLEHDGPKAQIWLENRDEPVWFSSVRDAFAFHFLPEEARDISAIYVNDMARAESWAQPGPGTWIAAREALYVIGSDRRGGMGAEEPVPFGTREAAEAFAEAHGGEIVPFDQVPEDYVLGATAEPAPMPPGNGHGDH